MAALLVFVSGHSGEAVGLGLYVGGSGVSERRWHRGGAILVPLVGALPHMQQQPAVPRSAHTVSCSRLSVYVPATICSHLLHP